MKKEKPEQIASYLQMLENTFKEDHTYANRKKSARKKTQESYQPKIEFLFPKTGNTTEASDL